MHGIDLMGQVKYDVLERDGQSESFQADRTWTASSPSRTGTGRALARIGPRRHFARFHSASMTSTPGE
jgi:hypothetical protein